MVITAAMFQFSGGISGVDGRAVVGPAGREPNVYVTNIGPHGTPGGEAGGVEFLLHAESSSPVDVMVTFTASTPSRAWTCSAENRRCQSPRTAATAFTMPSP